MTSQLLLQQTVLSSMAGLPRLVQSQLLLAAVGQQPLRSCCAGLPSHAQSFHTAAAQQAQSSSTSSKSADSTDGGSSSGGSSDQQVSQRQQERYRKRLNAYKSRLPKVQKYGTELRERDPQAFEQMRLVVGYYDLPQNLNKKRPAPPTHVTINNIQTLMHTDDVDPYYKLALLSYRSKLENIELVKNLSKTRSFLGQLSTQPDFVPAHLEELTAAALKQQQQQSQQQQSQDNSGAASNTSSSDSSEGSSSTAPSS